MDHVALKDNLTGEDLRQQIVANLRVHEAEVRAAGLLRLSLFGSVARGDADAGSDVDLVAELDLAARIGLFRLMTIERRLSELLGRLVDLSLEPVEAPRLRTSIERDRKRVF